MKVVIGSKNKAKVKAVQTVFRKYDIVPFSAISYVSNQPITNKETREGAINRAYDCYKHMPEALCIGLEGGVSLIDDTLYLCSWGALVANNELFIAGGSNIPLPDEFIEPIRRGIELAQLMDSYTQLHDVRQHEGAVGIFTNGAISRKELFIHIVKLLKGQWEYKKCL